jgi:ribonucleoside-diphosphate reductase beta chain
VTQTLSALVDHAPSEPERIYLCTQLADEARHVHFFQSYLRGVAGIDTGLLSPTGELGQACAYGQIYVPLLREVTAAVRANRDDRASWYRALVHYHLITEGVLAAPGLRQLRVLARHCELHALVDGLTNVSRDEGRHLTYGLSAARQGVDSGFADVIIEAYLDGVRRAVEVLVKPAQRTSTPLFRSARVMRVATLTEHWESARSRMSRNLSLIGLHHLRDTAYQVWVEAFEDAFTRYERAWGSPHPACTTARLSVAPKNLPLNSLAKRQSKRKSALKEE